MTEAGADYFGYSEEYWAGLSEQSRRVLRLVRPLPPGTQVTVGFGYLEQWLAFQEETAVTAGGEFNLCPDFQRGHVWTLDQQARYVENVLRNVAPLELHFNSPAYDGRFSSESGGMHPYDFVCVDGLQRLTAVREFIAGKLKIFNTLVASDLRGTPFDPFRVSLRFTMTIHTLKYRADLLRMYLDINNGGSIHTEAELERVRALLSSL